MPRNVLSQAQMFALLGWCQRNKAVFPESDAGFLAIRACSELGFYVTKHNVLSAGEGVGVKTRPQLMKAARDTQSAVAPAEKPRRVVTERVRQDRLPILAAAILRLYDELGVTPDMRLRAITEHRPLGS